MDFDSDNVNLLTVLGNDSNSWGTPGSNGAKVRFTGLGETLSGKIEVDTISSVDLYLLEGTTYTGSAVITANAVNTSQTDSPISINLDSTSKWIVTADTTISNLNAQSGASIIDEEGNTVSIVVNGDTVVSGTSKYTVTVTESYSDNIVTDSNNQLSTDYMDRSDFDSYYNVSTTFAGVAATTNVSASQETANATETNSSNDTLDSTEGTTVKEDESTNASKSVIIYVLGAACLIGAGGFLIYKKMKK